MSVADQYEGNGSSLALRVHWKDFAWNSQDLATDFNSTQLSSKGCSLVARGCYSKRTDKVCFVHTGSPREAERVLQGYLANPEAPYFHCPGAFLLIDWEARRLLAVVDRLGRKTLYFASDEEGVSVGTELGSVEREMHHPERLSEDGLYSYVYFHMVPAPLSVVPGVSKLRAAEKLEVTPEETSVQCHWVPHFNESRKGLDRIHMQHELKKLLRESVTRCLDGEHGVGAFLSGGLDSSSVVGMLSEVSELTPNAFAIGFEAKGYDEMAYARISAEHFGVKLHEYYVTPEDVVRALPEIAGSFSEPFGNSSALPAYFCARMAAQENVEVLLGGDGGDELFAGNERYAKQKVFERYQSIPAWLRQIVATSASHALPKSSSLGSKVQSFVRQVTTPLPERLWFYSFLEQTAPESVFTSGFLAEVDRLIVSKTLQGTYNSTFAASALNRMLHLDWQITLADNDLRKVDQACALAGVRVKYPLLDDSILDFSLAVPPAWKLPSGSLRKFYKDAMRGWLPEATLNKDKHGFGLPFGIWMREHAPLRELAYANVVRLGDRGIFRREFLELAIAQHRSAHASYYGEQVWVLCALELWLEANRPGFSYAN